LASIADALSGPDVPTLELAAVRELSDPVRRPAGDCLDRQ